MLSTKRSAYPCCSPTHRLYEAFPDVSEGHIVRPQSFPRNGVIDSSSDFSCALHALCWRSFLSGERRLCTAEVRGSTPLGSTLKTCGFAAKTRNNGEHPEC